MPGNCMQKVLIIVLVFAILFFFCTASISLELENTDKRNHQSESSSAISTHEQNTKQINQLPSVLLLDYKSTITREEKIKIEHLRQIRKYLRENGSTISSDENLENDKLKKSRQIFDGYTLPKTEESYGVSGPNYNTGCNGRSRHSIPRNVKGCETEFESAIKDQNLRNPQVLRRR